jgi:hypothetical protein
MVHVSARYFPFFFFSFSFLSFQIASFGRLPNLSERDENETPEFSSGVQPCHNLRLADAEIGMHPCNTLTVLKETQRRKVHIFEEELQRKSGTEKHS